MQVDNAENTAIWAKNWEDRGGLMTGLHRFKRINRTAGAEHDFGRRIHDLRNVHAENVMAPLEYFPDIVIRDEPQQLVILIGHTNGANVKFRNRHEHFSDRRI